MGTVWRMALKMGLEVCNHWNFTRGPILAFKHDTRSTHWGKGHKPFFFPFSKEKLKGNMLGQPLRGKEVMKKQQQALYVERGKAIFFVLYFFVCCMKESEWSML